MSKVGPIIELHPWLALPSGQALLDWEQAQVDRLVADVFGFHALQLGLPELDGLRCNRMPHKWLALDSRYAAWQPPADRAPLIHEPLVLPEGLMHGAPLGLRCEFEALPVASNSLDLVVLPHTLELSADPHQVLREVERVLVPEGRVVICGMNPASLWGLRQRRAHLLRRLGFGELYLPDAGEFIGYWRLRDWLREMGSAAGVTWSGEPGTAAEPSRPQAEPTCAGGRSRSRCGYAPAHTSKIPWGLLGWRWVLNPADRFQNEL